jgi:signal transduction histidine kinase
VRGSDELGQLAVAFNEMTGRIRSMLRDKEQLLLDVSHELRSPLARMRLSVELIDDARAADTLRADLDEMQRMTTTLLEAARETQPFADVRRGAHDVAALVREVAASFTGLRPGLTLDLPAAATTALLDPERARVAIRNVFENAVKYSLEDSEPVRVRVERGDETILVTVVDDGVGIPAAELERVFEPFYRVDRSRSKQTGGFGLGLHLALRLMKAQGGSISLASGTPRGVVARLQFEQAPA